MENRRSPEQKMLSKTLAFLNNFAVSSSSMNITEIASALGVTKPTAYSIVNSLMEYGYIEKDPVTLKYRTGMAFYILGQYYPRMYPFLMYAEHYVLAIYQKLNLRVNVCIYKEPLTTLVIASKDSLLIPRRNNGYTLPAHASSSGKILLSTLSDEKIEKILSENSLRQITQHTITDKSVLMERIREARVNGYAEDIEELVSGQACIAAPIYNSSNEVVCSISIAQIPVDRYRKEKEYFVNEITSNAHQISVDLGYSGY